MTTSKKKTDLTGNDIIEFLRKQQNGYQFKIKCDKGARYKQAMLVNASDNGFEAIVLQNVSVNQNKQNIAIPLGYTKHYVIMHPDIVAIRINNNSKNDAELLYNLVANTNYKPLNI